jgi:dephospho-CoA kinase
MRPTRSRPTSVAITGSVAAGKSEALQSFARHGAAVISSDDVVHRLLAEDEEVRTAVEKRFGTTDRGRIGETVFADRAELAWLEGLLHPRVRAAIASWREALDAPVAVVEVPLLYETGAEALFDVVVVITAPEELRKQRSPAARDGRADRLIPDAEKMKRADFAYVNDGTLDELDEFVATVLAALDS